MSGRLGSLADRDSRQAREHGLDAAIAETGLESKRARVRARFGREFADHLTGQSENANVLGGAGIVKQETFRVLHRPGLAIGLTDARPRFVDFDDLNQCLHFDSGLFRTRLTMRKCIP